MARPIEPRKNYRQEAAETLRLLRIAETDKRAAWRKRVVHYLEKASQLFLMGVEDEIVAGREKEEPTISDAAPRD